MMEDLSIIVTGLLSFLIFLGIHFISFRSLKAEHLFNAIKLTFVAAFIADLGLAFFVFHLANPLHILLSIVIFGLMAFFYVLCIFGPYETSIRMRLIREIAKDSQGKTAAEIALLYNERIILDTRLKRLLGGGDVALKNERYVLVKKTNAFFILDTCAGFLHAFINKR